MKETVPPLALVKPPDPTEPAAPREDASAELDPATLRRAQRGEAAACRALVLVYQRRVFAFVGRMLGAAGAARVEDLCQECFLRVFRALPRFEVEGPARLSTWIFTIASRLCVDEARRRRPLVALPEADALASDGLPEELAAAGALERRVARAVAALPDELRATFVLRVSLECSIADTARALDVDEGTVKSRLARARARLRELLGDLDRAAGRTGAAP